MKDTTKALLKQIENAHDWIEGQMYSGGGLIYKQTDTCQVCSLRRHYYSDEQNGVKPNYRFSDGETGEDLSLRQVMARGCLD